MRKKYLYGMLNRCTCLENFAMTEKYRGLSGDPQTGQPLVPGIADGSDGRVLPAGEGHSIRIAAPSWVMPGSILDNCLFLDGKVDEIELLFLETASCLAYGRQDLPPDLAGLSLSFHVHLPSDLPWEEGGKKTASICLALMEKVDFLEAKKAVLHPPDNTNRTRTGKCKAALEDFAREWERAGRAARDILLENTGENDLAGCAGMFGPEGFGLCPDLGHVLAYGQDALVAMLDELPEEARPGMVHCSAPGSGLPGRAPRGAHLPLDALDAAGLAMGETICSFLSPGGVLVAELFNWEYIERSLPVVQKWRTAACGAPLE